MKSLTVCSIVFCVFVTGCTISEFDIDKIGELRFTHTAISNGSPIHYKWVVPSSELRPILEQLKPRDPKYKGVLVSGGQQASLTYGDKDIRVRWSRVKIAEPVVLFNIRGNHYMLENPYAGDFYKLLAAYKIRVPIN